MFEDCAPRIAAGAGVGLRALQTLLDALAYARDARVDPWELAVELETLLEQGLSLTDVRWLVLRGYAEHAWRSRRPGRTAGCFSRFRSPSSLSARAWF
jgi:hypothetical protein